MSPSTLRAGLTALAVAAGVIAAPTPAVDPSPEPSVDPVVNLTALESQGYGGYGGYGYNDLSFFDNCDWYVLILPT